MEPHRLMAALPRNWRMGNYAICVGGAVRDCAVDGLMINRVYPWLRLAIHFAKRSRTSVFLILISDSVATQRKTSAMQA